MHYSKPSETEELIAQLSSEYSSTIETSTVLAILSDFNLAEPSQLESARRTLDILKESAEAEESSGFDASGSGGIELLPGDSADVRLDNDSASASGCSKSPPTWPSNTDDTSLSQAMSSLYLEGSEFLRAGADSPSRHDLAYGDEYDGLDVEAKESLLSGIFPTIKPFDIKWTLKKHKGDVNHVIDELMTQLFLDENGGRRRGIEAFSEGEMPLPRKTKGKRRRDRQTDNSVNSPASDPALQVSKWDAARKDIEFISLRSGMSTKQVGSIYHKNGGSLRATISAIIEAHLELKLESEDPVIHTRSIDLGHEFPAIPTSSLEALVQLSHPSTVHAHELAEALTTTQIGSKPSIQLDFRRPPLHVDHSPQTFKPSSNKASHSLFSPQTSLESVSNLAVKHIQARDTAFSQARAAYRKGKSDPLMGGAAAYYSQEARDADARARLALSAAADKLVEMQSWKGGLDLHGVGVEDAKRIVREKVTGWWHELGRHGNHGVGSGYRIVTGVGNHSEGGVGKLGPAVGKMLIREGWKVQVGIGFLVVTGVARST